jgi:hemicentin
MTSEGTLFIQNAVPKDAGIYGCLASNSAGTDKQTSTLRYIGKYHHVKKQLE